MRSWSPGSLVRLALCGLILFAGNCASGKEVKFKLIEKIPPACTESTYGPGDWLRETPHGDRERRYIVHVPPGYDRTKPVPVVLFLHGGAGSAETTRSWPGWDPLSDSKGFIVVYPDGTGPFKTRLHSWNAGNCGGWAFKNEIDDVGFFSKMLDELELTFCIDPKRVYSTGMSNGAMMSYRLAIELSDRIAAIGPVGGSLCLDRKESPSRPVSVIHFHGTADEHEPYEGGEGKKGLPGVQKRNVFRSVADTVAVWSKYIGASTEEVPVFTKGAAVRYTHGGGRDGSEVVLWKIKGGGHTWPGSPNVPGQRLLGETNHDVSATPLIWEFFLRHPIKEAEAKEKEEKKEGTEKEAGAEP